MTKASDAYKRLWEKGLKIGFELCYGSDNMLIQFKHKFWEQIEKKQNFIDMIRVLRRDGNEVYVFNRDGFFVDVTYTESEAICISERKNIPIEEALKAIPDIATGFELEISQIVKCSHLFQLDPVKNPYHRANQKANWRNTPVSLN